MNIIHSTKKEKPQPIVPILSHTLVPYYRKMRGRRIGTGGVDLGHSGPPLPVINPMEVARVKKRMAEGASIPIPKEEKPFDLSTFRPLPDRVLLKRPPQITEENGVALPEELYRSKPFFIVLRVGSRVTECAEGDKVIFSKNHHPKPVRLGAPLHIGRAAGIIALVED